MSTRSPLRSLRRVAGRAKRQLLPSPEVAAWRTACRRADNVGRYTPGTIDLAGFRIGYADLLTLCPQWRDIFVDRSLAFDAGRPDPVILDLGANVGLASLFFRREYPDAVIVAYEADPSLAILCRRNLEENGAADVAVRHAAVWTANEAVPFVREGADSGAVPAVGRTVSGPIVEVPGIRLRDVLAATPRVDLLKVDIEGAEHAVLPDCADVLERVGALVLEIHEFEPERRGMPALLELLDNAGFRYTIGSVTPLPWRGETGPWARFPHAATCFAATVRAWRP
jgi:FkbM family methyltransferase